MRIWSRYFDWLQKDNPTGEVEPFPALGDGFETSVHGMYCIGDLTGVPLINLAADSGRRLAKRLSEEAAFTAARGRNTSADVLDLVIIGAGPAGLACAVEAKQRGMRLSVLEASRPFNTLHNFPEGKPIHIVAAPNASGPFAFEGDTKEALLEELTGHPTLSDLPIVQGASVNEIERRGDGFVARWETGEIQALKVVIAIGKTGNARTLGVPGDDLPKVYTRLIDPDLFSGRDVLVVGGGDSALEAAFALERAGNAVTLSYRGGAFSRPKPANLDRLTALESASRITVVRNSEVQSIFEKEVVLHTADGTKHLPNDAVFALIGTEIPVAFFNRVNVRLQNERRYYDRLVLLAFLFFAGMMYFGKSASPTPIHSLQGFIALPKTFLALPFYPMLKGFLAWIAFLGLVVVSLPLLREQLRSPSRSSTHWERFKLGYFSVVAILFVWVYIRTNLQGAPVGGWKPSNWYAAVYSLTILIFGIRRIRQHPTAYIRKQTWTLILIQVFPLFVLPVFLLPFLGSHNLLPDWATTDLFPNGSYWRAYGFILGWPLFLYNLASGQPFVFWLLYSIAQTFIIIPYIVYRFGKGAYCGWICSCGALAETLGDEHRTKAPHGPVAKKWENAGQVVLLFATVITVLALLSTWAGISVPGTADLTAAYALIVDIVFAGVIGVGMYFTLSGRIWCRFLCPLAALMHIYARFTRYRIFSKKDRCISCGICTRVCHMGIDVMGFAHRGIPMNDVECVRCSACVVHCPMDVLTFGAQPGMDLNNNLCKISGS